MLGVKKTIMLLAVASVGFVASAQAVVTRTTTTKTVKTEFSDGTVATTVETDTVVADVVAKPASVKATSATSVAPDAFAHKGVLGHFTWGVDLSSGVDVTAHDMTMMDLGASFGYKGGILRFAGVGASIVSMMNNSSRCYPVYAMARTSFTPAHRLCFMEVKAGVSFNSILEYKSQTDLYGSLGIGLTLAHSRKFTSHVILRAVYMPLSPVEIDGVKHLNYHLGYAAIGIGCAF